MVTIFDVDNARDPENFMEVFEVDLFDSYYERGSPMAGLPLRIVQSTGVTVEKDFNVKVTDLNSDADNHRFKQFTNSGDGGVTFKVDVAIGEADEYGYLVSEEVGVFGMPVTSWLERWFVNMIPVYVVSGAIDVPNGVYLITKNQSRKQTLDKFTVWSLEFSSYSALELHEWTASQSVIKATTPASSSSTTNNSSSKAKQLKDCTASNIVYSTTEKKTECNKLMQEKLYKLGFLRADQVDGWYGPVTMEAVKKFQKWYNSKGHNLLVDGDCGAVTLKALINS